MSSWYSVLADRREPSFHELAAGIPFDWSLRANLYANRCSRLNLRHVQIEGGVQAFAADHKAALPTAVVDGLQFDLDRSHVQHSINMLLASTPVREEHIRSVVVAHAFAAKLTSYIPGSVLVAAITLRQHAATPSSTPTPVKTAPKSGPRTYVPGMLAARAAQLTINDGGLTSEAISAAYLSYAALMAQRQATTSEHLKADALLLSDILARRCDPELCQVLSHTRAFDAVCLLECISSWSTECFTFGGRIRASGTASDINSADLSLTLRFLDTMLFAGVSAAITSIVSAIWLDDASQSRLLTCVKTMGDAAVFSAFTDAPMLWTSSASFDQLCADMFALEIVDLASWSQRQLSVNWSRCVELGIDMRCVSGVGTSAFIDAQLILKQNKGAAPVPSRRPSLVELVKHQRPARQSLAQPPPPPPPPPTDSTDSRSVSQLVAENASLQRRCVELTRRAYEEKKRADRAEIAVARSATAGSALASSALVGSSPVGSAPVAAKIESESAMESAERQTSVVADETALAAKAMPAGKLSSMPGLRDVQVTLYRATTAETPPVPGSQVLSPQPVRHFAIDASPLPFDMLSRALRCPCVYMEGFLGKITGHSGLFSSSSVSQRWFVLKGPFLTYFKSSEETRPIKDRVLNIRGQRIRSSNNDSGGLSFPFAFAIDIVSNGTLPASVAAGGRVGGGGANGGLDASVGQTLLLFAQTESLRATWIEVLSAAAALPTSAT